MLRSDPAWDSGPLFHRSRFVFYVEGPRDRDILRSWARRFSPLLARSLERSAVILGGRQPVRAVNHFRALGGAVQGARGLCVLDRDDAAASAESLPQEPGLEFFTWKRRHIESYLLVPEAIRRCLRSSRVDPREKLRVDRLLKEHLPGSAEEERLREIDAKRLLAAAGPLARGLGRSLRSGRIASVMQKGEMHPDVIELFERLQAGLRGTEPDADNDAG